MGLYMLNMPNKTLNNPCGINFDLIFKNLINKYKLNQIAIVSKSFEFLLFQLFIQFNLLDKIFKRRTVTLWGPT